PMTLYRRRDMALELETKPRPADMSNMNDGGVLYVRSYLITRTVVGLIGILLPFALMIGERYFNGSVHNRGSLSAYYHSPMQDIFVGSLCTIGVLLLTYMSGQWRTVDFVFSSIAGVAVLGVALMPTTRSDLTKDAALCGPHTLPVPPGCSSIESAWG